MTNKRRSNLQLLEEIHYGKDLQEVKASKEELLNRNLSAKQRMALEQELQDYRRNKNINANKNISLREWWHLILGSLVFRDPKDDFFKADLVSDWNKYGFEKKLRQLQRFKPFRFFVVFILFVIFGLILAWSKATLS